MGHRSGRARSSVVTSLSHPGATVGAMTGRIKDMDRWLGDGGMELIGTVGGSFDAYGVDGEDLGWVRGHVHPRHRRPAIPHGIVQAGVHGLLLDAAMNFAINAPCPAGPAPGPRSR